MANKNTIWIVLGIILLVVVALNYSKISLSLNNSFSAQEYCGNGECEIGENYSSCPVDCPYTCQDGEKVEIQCGDGWAFNWYSKQCIENNWVEVYNQNPCFCASDSYCSSGYKCKNNVCTQSIPQTCANTLDCGVRGFYCDLNHTCKKCSSTYSLFSVYDCQFSSYSCIDANSCYSLSDNYCSKWLCQNSQCIDQGDLRYEGCCDDSHKCSGTDVCSNYICQAKIVKKVSPVNVGITALIILGLVIGGYFIYKKVSKNG